MPADTYTSSQSITVNTSNGDVHLHFGNQFLSDFQSAPGMDGLSGLSSALNFVSYMTLISNDFVNSLSEIRGDGLADLYFSGIPPVGSNLFNGGSAFLDSSGHMTIWLTFGASAFDISSGRLLTFEEMLMHELAHVELGHVGQVPTPALEQAATNHVDNTFRDSLGLAHRDDYGDSNPILGGMNRVHFLFEDRNCFPAGTPITLADGSTKPIEQITTTDKILTHDANGTPVAGIVDKLFTNTTNAFIRLSFTDTRDDLITTPGHRFLTEVGDYMEIGHMLRLGGGTVRLVEQDGSVITATGEVLEYSAKTADMFPVTATKTIAFEEGKERIYGFLNGCNNGRFSEHSEYSALNLTERNLIWLINSPQIALSA